MVTRCASLGELDMAAGPSSAASVSEVQSPSFRRSLGPVNSAPCQLAGRDRRAKKKMMNLICLGMKGDLGMEVVNVSNTAEVTCDNKKRMIIDSGVIMDEEDVHMSAPVVICNKEMSLVIDMDGLMDDEDFGNKVAVAQHGDQQCCSAATTTMLWTLMEGQSEFRR